MMDGSLRNALLGGAALFLLALIGAAYMLLRDVRGQERYGSRVRQIHGEERATLVKPERVALLRL